LNHKKLKNGFEKSKKQNKENKKMLEKIKEIAADSLGADVSTMTAETSFKEDLGADSLDLFEMVMALEEEFEVEIPTEDLENIKTIGDVESYLQSRQ
jgi:acyl carrier protein